MRDLPAGAIGALAFFGILYAPLDGELRNLLIAILCLMMFGAYLAKAKLANGQIEWPAVCMIFLPTALFVAGATINYIYQLAIGGLYFWVPYLFATSGVIWFVGLKTSSTDR